MTWQIHSTLLSFDWSRKLTSLLELWHRFAWRPLTLTWRTSPNSTGKTIRPVPPAGECRRIPLAVTPIVPVQKPSPGANFRLSSTEKHMILALSTLQHRRHPIPSVKRWRRSSETLMFHPESIGSMTLARKGKLCAIHSLLDNMVGVELVWMWAIDTSLLYK